MKHARRKSRRAKWVWISAVLVLLVVLGALAGYAVLAARSSAERALADFEFVQHNISSATSKANRTQLEQKLRGARAESLNANGALYSTGILRVLGWVPYFGDEITGASTLFRDSASAASSGLSLLHSVDSFQSNEADGNISNASLISLQKSAAKARTRFRALKQPVGHLFGLVGRERASFDHKVSKVLSELTNAENGLTVARSLFGNGATSTVLVMPENNAEMRDQGSILSYSLLKVRGSSLSVLQSGSVGNINLSSPLAVPSSPGTRSWFYGNGANEIFQSVNATADFSWTGATAAALFEKSTGIHVNDVIALDVPAMAAMVGVTGPLSIPGITRQLTETNFSTVVLHDLYEEYPVGSQIPRKTELNDIATTLLQRLQSNPSNRLTLLRALANEIPGRHLLMWSSNPAVESAITKLGASGKVNTVLPKHTFHVAVESAVAAKLGYYVTLRESYNVQLLAKGAAWVTTNVTEVNHAPAGQPPSYQLGPDGLNAHVPGEYVSNNYLWSPEGSKVVDGSPESGLVLTGQSAVVMPQHSTTTQFLTYLPKAVRNGRFLIHLVPQPTLQPAEISVTVHGSTWRVKGRSSGEFPLNRSLTLEYDVTKKTK